MSEIVESGRSRDESGRTRGCRAQDGQSYRDYKLLSHILLVGPTWLKLCKRGWLLVRVPLRPPQRYGCAMTHARVWKFRPPAGREEDFHAAYSGTGNWAQLFEQAPGYRGTELLRPVEAGGWWLTIDRWDSEAHFTAFQDDFGVQYRGLDKVLEGVAGEEVFVGAFEE